MAPGLAPTSGRAPRADLPDKSPNHQRAAATNGITLSNAGSRRERARTRPIVADLEAARFAVATSPKDRSVYYRGCSRRSSTWWYADLRLKSVSTACAGNGACSLLCRRRRDRVLRATTARPWPLTSCGRERARRGRPSGSVVARAFRKIKGWVGVRWRRMAEVMVPRRAQWCGTCHQGWRRRDGSCGGISIAPRPGQARHVGQRNRRGRMRASPTVKRQVRGPLVRIQPRPMHRR